MCDFSTILAYFITGEAAILAAIIACGIAIGLNASFFGAVGAPIPMAAAVFSVGLAAAAFAPAAALLGTPQCTSAQCASQAAAAWGTLAVITGILAASLIAGVVTIAISSAVGAGAVAMGIYAGALIVASLAIPKATTAILELQRCLDAKTTPAAEVANVVGWVIGATAIIFVAVIFVMEKQPKGEKDPFPKD